MTNSRRIAATTEDFLSFRPAAALIDQFRQPHMGLSKELRRSGTRAQTGTVTRPVALFVLGMGRSGTSALTRVLSLCGGALPGVLTGADAGNPLGYWEPRAAIDLNAAILHRHGSSVFDPSLRLQEETALDAQKNAACIADIKEFLTTLPGAPFVVIKDLSITGLSGMWFEAARQAGLEIAAVIAVRHPQEVSASFASHPNLRVPPELASALWLKNSLLAERHTRGLPRVFVEYANLLEDWRPQIQRISTALGIELNIPDEGAIDEFLKPDLRHQRQPGTVTEIFGTDWISTVYEVLSGAARDEPCDASALDRVYAAYRASEHGFRTVFGHYRHFNTFVQITLFGRTRVFNSVLLHSLLARPSIAKLIRAIVSLATRPTQHTSP